MDEITQIIYDAYIKWCSSKDKRNLDDFLSALQDEPETIINFSRWIVSGLSGEEEVNYILNEIFCRVNWETVKKQILLFYGAIVVSS